MHPCFIFCGALGTVFGACVSVLSMKFCCATATFILDLNGRRVCGSDSMKAQQQPMRRDDGSADRFLAHACL